jgi:hypothetical protein
MRKQTIGPARSAGSQSNPVAKMCIFHANPNDNRLSDVANSFIYSIM